MTLPYTPGHPWFYVQGGKPLYPVQILIAVKERGYQGYLTDDFDAADRLREPKRSERLRQYREGVRKELADDICAYRAIVRTLSAYRKTHECDAEPVCADVHTAVSLKHNHIYNHLAHLVRLDGLLAQQPDLFAALKG